MGDNNASDARATQGNQLTTHQVPRQRARVSLIAMAPPMTWAAAHDPKGGNKSKRTTGTPFDKWELLDPDQLVALHASGVDDLTIVKTITFNLSNKPRKVDTDWDELKRVKNSDEAAMRRLTLLGYYFGPADGLDPQKKHTDQADVSLELTRAVTWFQEDENLKVTGLLDDATKQAIHDRGSRFAPKRAPEFERYKYFRPKPATDNPTPADYHPPRRDNTEYVIDGAWPGPITKAPSDNPVLGCPSLTWSVSFGEPRVKYMEQLVAACRTVEPRVQVIIGYVLGQTDTDCVKFFEFASDQQVDQHAREIAHMVAALNVDGVNFDIEIGGKSGLSARHAHNVERLLRTTAVALAPENKIVAYDGAPFRWGEDGSDPFSPQMENQRYAACRGMPNMIARPQCYGSKDENDTGYGAGDVTNVDEQALKDATALALDKGDKGGGMFVSQLQYLIPSKDCPRFCDAPLKDQGVGIVLYALGPAPSDIFDSARRCNDKLNGPDAPAPGTPGTPRQVPRK